MRWLPYWPRVTSGSMVGSMSDQMFDLYRKASESWLKMQQGLFQQGPPASLFVAPLGAGVAPEWARTAQKTWIDLTAEILNSQRESVDGLYESAIHLFQPTPKGPEDHPANSSKGPQATRKSSSGTSRRSRKSR